MCLSPPGMSDEAGGDDRRLMHSGNVTRGVRWPRLTPCFTAGVVIGPYGLLQTAAGL